MTELARRWTPATATYAMAAGHTAWGLAAHRDQIAGILADLPGSVGDGIFDHDHSRDERATAFWFFFVGSLVALLGRTYAAAEATDDRRQDLADSLKESQLAAGREPPVSVGRHRHRGSQQQASTQQR